MIGHRCTARMIRRVIAQPRPIPTYFRHSTQDEGNVMNMYRLALGITIGLTLTAATGWAADSPKEKKIRSEFACSSVPSTFDTNGDGTPGPSTSV